MKGMAGWQALDMVIVAELPEDTGGGGWRRKDWRRKDTSSRFRVLIPKADCDIDGENDYAFTLTKQMP